MLNIPTDPNIAEYTIIGNHTQVNLSDGGVIEERVQVGSRQGLNANIEINIAGGIVEERFTAYNKSTVNISGGNVGSNTHFGGIKQGNFTGGEQSATFSTSGKAARST
ncbi:hypothetical protein [Adhaeretor mobilis]|uniref:Uncharacterized protein n=1 Tax=Adhaeretor mobilis TaxID=1930276 RepID=A0A517N2K2_9BACT|nr:hypothetical protein [Adhaeretor mobilis]QDT01369.1 hypothetical protein HG15A2_47110 [Adhaeretor mobilis]